MAHKEGLLCESNTRTFGWCVALCPPPTQQAALTFFFPFTPTSATPALSRARVKHLSLADAAADTSVAADAAVAGADAHAIRAATGVTGLDAVEAVDPVDDPGRDWITTCFFFDGAEGGGVSVCHACIRKNRLFPPVLKLQPLR
jgi:hypothetical protein